MRGRESSGMLVILVNEQGERWEGLLVAIRNGVARFIGRGLPDSVELGREGDRWISPDGQKLELAAVIADDHVDVSIVSGRRAGAAGRF
jgi:hypothetical protein